MVEWGEVWEKIEKHLDPCMQDCYEDCMTDILSIMSKEELERLYKKDVKEIIEELKDSCNYSDDVYEACLEHCYGW